VFHIISNQDISALQFFIPVYTRILRRSAASVFFPKNRADITGNHFFTTTSWSGNGLSVQADHNVSAPASSTSELQFLPEVFW
jgi:hypothetical protein